MVMEEHVFCMESFLFYKVLDICEVCSSRALLGRRAGDPRGAGKVREGDIQEISLTISIHILTS